MVSKGAQLHLPSEITLHTREKFVRFIGESVKVELVAQDAADATKALHELGSLLRSVGNKLESST